MAPPFPPALKRLGQNFLIDPNIIRKIVAAAALRPDDLVLEIGPGRGALTAGLCAEAGRVIAVEIDPQLQPHLQQNLAHCRNLDLRIEDALKFPFDTFAASHGGGGEPALLRLHPALVRSAGCPRSGRSHGSHATDGGGPSSDGQVQQQGLRNSLGVDARGGRRRIGLSRLPELFPAAPVGGICRGAFGYEIP